MVHYQQHRFCSGTTTRRFCSGAGGTSPRTTQPPEQAANSSYNLVTRSDTVASWHCMASPLRRHPAPNPRGHKATPAPSRRRARTPLPSLSRSQRSRHPSATPWRPPRTWRCSGRHPRLPAPFPASGRQLRSPRAAGAIPAHLTARSLRRTCRTLHCPLQRRPDRPRARPSLPRPSPPGPRCTPPPPPPARPRSTRDTAPRRSVSGPQPAGDRPRRRGLPPILPPWSRARPEDTTPPARAFHPQARATHPPAP